jgi:hypothetical protein
MAIVGIDTTYNLNVGEKLDVEDVIWLISPFDAPLQGMYGMDNLSALSTDSCFETNVTWLDDVLLLPSSTTQANVTTTTATTIQVATGDQAKFGTGDVLELAAEKLYVSGYGTTADYLIVTRGFGGTTAATSNTGAAIVGVGEALPEGSTPANARAVDRNSRTNYTQIFGPVAVSVSETEQAIQKYGVVGTEFDYQVGKKTKEQIIKVDQACLYGAAYAGSSTNGRMMGGFTNWITTNVDSSSTTLSDTTLLSNLSNAWTAGGNPDRILCGMKQKRNISGVNSTEIRYAQDTNVRGQVVDYYDWDGGRVSIVLDRWCKNADLFIFSRDQATIRTLRPLTFEMLAKTGDFRQGQVVGEKTLEFRRQAWAAWMSALT